MRGRRRGAGVSSEASRAAVVRRLLLGLAPPACEVLALRAAHPMLVAGAVVGSLAVQGGRHARILREQRAACAAACDCSGQAAPSDHPDETDDSTDAAWSPSHDPEN